MLSKQIIENVLVKTLEVGADFGEIYIEKNHHTNITLIGDKLEKGFIGRDFGIGIRLIAGLSVFYVATNDKREENLIAMVENLGSMLRAKQTEKMLLGKIREFQISPFITPFRNMAYEKKMRLVREIVKAGKNYNPLIKQMRVNYLDFDQEVIIANTEALYVGDRRMKTRIHTTAMASDGGNMQTGYVGPAYMGGSEFYDGFDADAHIKTPADIAMTMLYADYAPTGKMAVIVENGFGGLLFHEACGHSLETTFVAKNLSEFSGRQGEKVAFKDLTLIDDGSIPHAWGSSAIDDEGIETRKNILIENGILKGYLTDKMGAKRMGTRSTGSARRQNYRFAPVARMNNTYIENGNDKKEDIIKDTAYGIYVKNLNGGSVNPATGEFNFATAETYLIEKGEIKNPVKGATLIGTGGDILQKVDKIADNGKLGDGYCYAQSGQLFICAGQPTVRISEMTVGGMKHDG